MNEQVFTAEQINDLRKRYAEGGTWTRQELKSAIETMMGERVRDVQTPAKQKKSIPKSNISLDDLL